jgi:hypothetical protein
MRRKDQKDVSERMPLSVAACGAKKGDILHGKSKQNQGLVIRFLEDVLPCPDGDLLGAITRDLMEGNIEEEEACEKLKEQLMWPNQGTTNKKKRKVKCFIEFGDFFIIFFQFQNSPPATKEKKFKRLKKQSDEEEGEEEEGEEVESKEEATEDDELIRVMHTAWFVMNISSRTTKEAKEMAKK